MKFKLISIFTAFLLFGVTAFCAIPEAYNEENDNGERTGDWVVLFDEELNEYFDYENAAFYGMLTYENGNIASPLKVYFPSGQFYFESEVLQINPVEIADGQVTFYEESGIILRKITYKNGERNGPAEYMDEEGNVWQKGQYVEGLTAGDWVEYYEDGTYGMGTLENDVKIGFWKYYQNDGILEAEGLWLNGKRDGEWKYYTIEGDVYIKGSFKDDIEVGEWTQYYEDNSYGKGKMTNYLKQGQWSFYSPEGVLTLKGSYIDDEQDGNWYQYDADGNITDTVTYELGVEVEE
jgi:antitoxin component YwqK of YwqJK toxin-antitoxin module